MEMGGGSGGGVQSISRVVLYRSLSRGYFYDNTSSNDVTVVPCSSSMYSEII